MQFVFGIEILVMVAMICINSVFAAYEIALASITKSRLQMLLRDKRAGSRAASYMKDNMERSLAVVQLGITLVGAIAAATGGAGAQEQFAPFLRTHLAISSQLAEVLGIALVVFPLTIVTIIVGELIPKVFALRNQEWVCLRLSPAMSWFSVAVWPLVWLLESSVISLLSWGERLWQKRIDQHVKIEGAALQELRASVALARTSRLIGAHEEKIILGAAALSQRPVRDIMLPADFVSMLDINATMAESLVAAHLDMHTRFPVTERAGDPQAIVGYVNFKDIVAQLRLAPQYPSLRAIVRTMPSLRENLPQANCLEQMIRGHTHIALVRNAADQVVGIVTLEDMIEELVGEIEDEFDRLPAHVVPTGGGWVVGGGISLDQLRQATGAVFEQDMPATGARNLSDWVIGHLQQPVRGGEVIERAGARTVVRKVRRQKVLEAQVESRPAGSNPAPDSSTNMRSTETAAERRAGS
jgi:putative hemolysin